MPDDPSAEFTQPDTFLADELYVFDEVAVPAPPGTKAPPRPPGKERRVSELPVTQPFEIFTEQPTPLPPGTKAPPRPPGKERVSVPQPPVDVALLVARIETALQTIHAALAQIKQIQNKAS